MHGPWPRNSGVYVKEEENRPRVDVDVPAPQHQKARSLRDSWGRGGAGIERERGMRWMWTMPHHGLMWGFLERTLGNGIFCRT
ncbi:hypothetical protein MSAN_01985900 [Mycena sanguinolenta]|uniref:Uncharacterized protein n=1 Tax=Mycena sanguinolenta TaxID=230812 RepID=A0A8H6XL44_9AGAR|nr:hypothetical protein MSAN_01985900 [Mycena sanguinolenta]